MKPEVGVLECCSKAGPALQSPEMSPDPEGIPSPMMVVRGARSGHWALGRLSWIETVSLQASSSPWQRGRGLLGAERNPLSQNF